jgi:hypothetical protein
VWCVRWRERETERDPDPDIQNWRCLMTKLWEEKFWDLAENLTQVMMKRDNYEFYGLEV